MANRSREFDLFCQNVFLAMTLGLFHLTACADDPTKPKITGDSGSVENQCAIFDSTLRTANANDLFALEKVPTFDFYLPEADWESLKTHAREEAYVPVKACYEGRGIGTVGLRFKGSYGSLFECFDKQGNLICPRLSMKMKFDEYVDEQRFFGLKRISLNAYLHDDSRMKEKLAYDLFRAMDIVTPRSAWAILRVNGQSQGLFGMVEVVDGRFTKDRWPQNPDGNLYKELWPTQATDQKMVSALETNEEIANISAYHSFAQAMASADEDNLRATLSHYMDLDYLARFLAVEDALLSYDGITYFWTNEIETTNHNFFIYEESPTRFTLIPWDTESTFWINPDHTAPHWTVIPSNCKQTYAYWGGLAYAPGCDKVFRALVSDLSSWRAAARRLLDGPFSVNAMAARIDEYTKLIGDLARTDPTPTKYSTFDGAVSSIRSAIPALRTRLLQLIATKTEASESPKE